MSIARLLAVGRSSQAIDLVRQQESIVQGVSDSPSDRLDRLPAFPPTRTVITAAMPNNLSENFGSSLTSLFDTLQHQQRRSFAERRTVASRVEGNGKITSRVIRSTQQPGTVESVERFETQFIDAAG